MNERLTIQGPHSLIPGWLPFGRCDTVYGSGHGKPARRDDGYKRQYLGNPYMATNGSFSRQARDLKENASNSGPAEKVLTFCARRFT
jgi:hypothetical protein